MRVSRSLNARPLSLSLARLSSPLAVCAAIVGTARGAGFLYWDGDSNPANDSYLGTGLGGLGQWNTSTQNWWNGSADVAWSNTAPLSTAVFTGTPGVVTLAVPITAANLVFNTGGYTIAGG